MRWYPSCTQAEARLLSVLPAEEGGARATLLEARDRQGRHATMHAAAMGHVHALELLLKGRPHRAVETDAAGG